jgi:hypothetical protein
MKALVYVIAALIVLTSTHCKRLSEFTQFEMNYMDTTVIESLVGINLPFNLISPNIKSNSETEFSIHDTRKDLIEFISLTELEMRLLTPSEKDLSFLKSIDIYIYAEGLDETLIAWKYDIPDTIGDTLILETTSEDLQDYIKKDIFNLKIQTVTDKLILSDHEVEIYSAFFVDARILGL